MFIFLNGSALKLLPPPVFREQKKDEPAAAGENTVTPEASSTEAALPSKVYLKNPPKTPPMVGINKINDRPLVCR